MLLHVHEWGDPAAPPLVCVHGVTAHGLRFRRLAEDCFGGRFRVLAPDLRGHGRSGYDPPWTLRTLVADLLDTLQAAGVERAPWVGHSLGGRLILELAALEPQRIERAALLDPAIEILPHVGFDFAEDERKEKSFASAEDAIATRMVSGHADGTPLEFIEEEMREHLEPGPDGRLRYRYCRSASVSLYGELCTPPPPPRTLLVPTLLLYASDFGLVRDEQVEEYRAALGPSLDIVTVPGGHVVYWDAYAETADALDAFLAA